MSAPPRRCWVGNAASSACAVGQRTHPAEVRTTSSIRCGAGTVGYRTDWPGKWYSPVILKITIAGVRGCLLTAGSWSQHPQPHRSGSTVGGGSPRYWTASLFPFLQTCISAGEPANSSVSSHSLNHLSSWVLAARSKPFKKLKPCFYSGRREWQSPRMGRLALSPEEHASALSAQRRQRKLCPNFFLHNLHTRTLATR